MRAVIVMFDSLNRASLPPYGGTEVIAPHFERLATHTATFDRCYAGSMPCMPARRELHTGRHNFLHRSWGPLEPFDDSMPEILKNKGIHTHLVTDHPHYWEDGGATYHNRFSTYEFVRGQEGDLWKADLAEPARGTTWTAIKKRQDSINRRYTAEESSLPQSVTFDLGLEFLDTNHEQDNWLLQVETFDPHEPFVSTSDWHSLYPEMYDGPESDWPEYRQVLESRAEVEHITNRYRALVSKCDHSLGRILDCFDRHSLWDTTALVVMTDHGYLLGEHNWWAKSVPPWYEETIHTPLFVWDPRTRVRGERRSSLVQTIDIAPTLLDFFDQPIPADMQGHPLLQVITADSPVRDAALFGAHGGHVNVTDGRWVYMRAPHNELNKPLYEYTLMPTHMHAPFTPAELRTARITPPSSFSKGVPLLRIDATQEWTNPHAFGTLLFDLESDPLQQFPLIDDQVELTMINKLLGLMRANDAPLCQYERLGLPPTDEPSAEHLQVQRQWQQVLNGLTPIRPTDYPDTDVSTHTPLSTLLQDPRAKEILARRIPRLLDADALAAAGDLSLIEIAATAIGIISPAMLQTVSDELVDE